LDTDLTRKVMEKINGLVDQETTRKFGELNIVTDVSEMASGSVRIRFQPLSPYSPLAVDIGRDIREAALSVEGVKAVRVECGGHIMDELVNRIVNNDDIKLKKTQ
jgi:metal-sulfur cluster biosynthetic enzyme